MNAGTKAPVITKMLLFCYIFTFFLILPLLNLHTTFLSLSHAKASGNAVIIQIKGPTEPPGFFPALLTLHLYDTVIFKNQALPATKYAVSADDGSFSSPAIPAGGQWQVTFNNLGAHEYHETALTQSMVGEILIVDNTVSLLPTPLPAVEATIIALVKAGKPIPDTIILPTPTPPTHFSPGKINGTASLPLVPLLSGTVAIVLLITGIVIFLRRRRRKSQVEDLDDDDQPKAHRIEHAPNIPQKSSFNVWQKLKLLLLKMRRKKKEEEEDVDNEWDDL